MGGLKLDVLLYIVLQTHTPWSFILTTCYINSISGVGICAQTGTCVLPYK